MIEMFQQFLRDKEAPAMYITGVAGTGKTTSLAELITYCNDNRITTVTSAYTHKAVGVLRSKLPKITKFSKYQTLHSFLKKTPTINDKAEKLAHVEGNSAACVVEIPQVLFIDEFSMVGEKDYVDINDMQYNEDGDLVTKVVYIGDPNQLPPVKDQPSIVPSGPYWFKLTKVHRQAKGNPLLDTLLQLNDYINGKQAEALTPHETFIRGVDIEQLFANCKEDKILLAYTNARVQELNANIEGRENPIIGSEMFSPTVRKFYSYEDKIENPAAIVTIRDKILERDSQYKTLETLVEIPGIEFCHVLDKEGVEVPRAMIFGHQRYLDKNKELAEKAVKLNNKIRDEFKMDPKDWSQMNYGHELSRERRKAWSQYMSFKDCVLCMDFTHAMTVHKSQGSTYENVFIDMEDISKCARTDYIMYLKLLYVAISRASKICYTN